MSDYAESNELAFAQRQLQNEIPNKLEELLRKLGSIDLPTEEEWLAEVFRKLIVSTDFRNRDLLDAISKENVPLAAWVSRNLLELWIWSEYCSALNSNARRFYEDALRDIKGISESLSTMHALQGIPNEFEKEVNEGITRLAKEKLGRDSVDGAYERIANAARSVGLEEKFVATNRLLSKFAHPTAAMVIGIQHQTKLVKLKAPLITMGLYFSGQCVIALDRAVSKILALPTAKD